MTRALMLPLLMCAVLAACTTGSGKRTADSLIGPGDMAALGATAFDQLKLKGRISADYDSQSFVRCVAEKLIAELPTDERDQRWEILVFEDSGASAFALPGGKIGVHREMLDVIGNEEELAALIAHELGHLGNQHPAHRVAAEFTAEAAVAAVQTFRGENGPPSSRKVYALLGLGAQVGLSRPHSRQQEAVADDTGISLLARAGYPPDAMPRMWRTLDEHPQQLAWLDLHPDPQRRLEPLEASIEAAMPAFDATRAAGRRPRCR